MTRGRQAITTRASIQQMIEAGDERRMGSSALNLTIDTGNVAVAGLSFTYPGAAAPSLTEIDLTIEAGERVAIVGRVRSRQGGHRGGEVGVGSGRTWGAGAYYNKT